MEGEAPTEYSHVIALVTPSRGVTPSYKGAWRTRLFCGGDYQSPGKVRVCQREREKRRQHGAQWECG